MRVSALLVVAAVGVAGCPSTVSTSSTSNDAAVTSDLPSVTPPIAKIASSGAVTCALRSDGRVRCWGRYVVSPADAGASRPAWQPVEIDGLADAIDVAVSEDDRGCAVTRSGDVRCWSMHGDGALRPPLAELETTAPPATQIALGDGWVCTIGPGDAGAVWCGGDNRFGTLGLGDFEAHPAGGVVALPAPAREVAIGSFGTCARLADGSVWCWGRNYSGALGDGVRHQGCGPSVPDEDCSPTPVRVALPRAAEQLSAGLNGACARVGTQAFCWGWGTNGRLLSGSEADSVVPAVVPGLDDVAFVFAGYLAGCVLRRDASTWCAGFGVTTEGTDAGEVTSLQPVRIGGVGPARAVTGGWYHLCALQNDGAVLCWGNGGYGQLGVATTARGPVRVEGL